MKKNLKKLFAILMTVAVVLSMAMPAMAADNQVNKGGRTAVNVTQRDVENGKLTIKPGAAKTTYTIYKVFTATLNDGDNTYTWTAESAWNSVLHTGTDDEISADDIAGYGADAMQKLAADLAAVEPKPTAAASNVEPNAETSLKLGYYLVVDNGSEGLEKSQPILVAIPQVVDTEWVYDISVTPKSSHTDFEKKIRNEKGELIDTNTANVGDFVTYYLSADIPTYEKDAYDNETKHLQFRITDTMSEELTWVVTGTNDNVSSVEVYVVADTKSVADAVNTNLYKAVANTDYELKNIPTEDKAGATFTVDFSDKDAFLKEYQGKVVVVVFKAKLNSNAVIGTDVSGKDNTIDGYETLDGKPVDHPNYYNVGNPNGATLEYTNNYYGEEGTATIDDTVTTFSFKLDVEKIDAEDGTKLDDAVFKVYKSKKGAEDESDTDLYKNDLNPDGVTLTTVGGVAFAEGFAEGDYYLKETEAPDGYKRFDGVITVHITKIDDAGNYNYTITMGDTPADGNPKVVQVKDEKGATLPGTGGIGTTIFTFGGLALIVLAGILLVVYTRKQKKAKV